MARSRTRKRASRSRDSCRSSWRSWSANERRIDSLPTIRGRAMAEPVVKPNKMRDMAASIYVELCTQAVSITETSVKMSASAENLAKLSFKLADAFGRIEIEIADANKPKSDFKLSEASIADWNK